MSSILLVDDHAVVRNGLKQMLIEHLGSVVLGEANDAIEAMQQVRKQDWGLVVLDIRLPGRSGVDVLKQIKSEKPHLPVLILSSYPESQYAVRLIQAGAAGYISKDSEETEIIKAVKTAAAGGRYINEIVGGLLANTMSRSFSNADDLSLYESLSDREYQIFLELASGKRAKDIAEKLQVSAKTVATHRSRLMQKMGFSTNAELILYANKSGLLL
ncbi:regulatory protein, LuxR:Response regulator receiver [gamma proteobacterium HTCC2207]|jgi:two-component system invasion response regulator UvrY|uniref:Regulatory protein, LuxR:Response regulator receiver n=1 Tax=gamma proteobacterium HTCC2207 TaxID=314287 RepID=Q1YTG7_9GAMM|nr:regulatory protein, LuxR:Response regulator receiver [gamma proteobacterium HTCC2207]MBT3620300.1 response regulator transcription factor [Porticoccaceae bacterium]MBT6115017.1 response regulator transcription factor [Porticoccaceae bacterium]MBT6592478.1 response regulator transcription factor [Porticoccaceae bacterium]MCT2529614.1 response regulator transcription factor [SAR92 clade bacterium H921]